MRCGLSRARGSGALGAQVRSQRHHKPGAVVFDDIHDVELGALVIADDDSDVGNTRLRLAALENVDDLDLDVRRTRPNPADAFADGLVGRRKLCGSVLER